MLLRENNSAAMGNAFANAAARTRYEANLRAQRNSAILWEKSWEKRRKEYIERLDRHRKRQLEEWQANYAQLDHAKLSEEQLAILEVIAGIGTLVWAENLKGKHDDLLYGAVCPIALERMGRELIERSHNERTLRISSSVLLR